VPCGVRPAARADPRTSETPRLASVLLSHGDMDKATRKHDASVSRVGGLSARRAAVEPGFSLDDISRCGVRVGLQEIGREERDVPLPDPACNHEMFVAAFRALP
jgi:uncharacterized caspase-like protein